MGLCFINPHLTDWDENMLREYKYCAEVHTASLVPGPGRPALPLEVKGDRESSSGQSTDLPPYSEFLLFP